MSSTDKEHHSDKEPSVGLTVPKLVMAEQITHHVVKEAQSMGGASPIDDSASTTNTSAGNGEAPSGPSALNSKPSDAFSTTTNVTTKDAAAAGTEHPSDTDAVSASVAPTDSQALSEAPLKETKEQLVNGDSGEHSSTDSQNAAGDASGGSDTDISRPGSVDQAKRTGGHLRTNSVKKPASFKSVSVTKNFLAKSAVTAPVVRPGDKIANTGQSSAAAQLTAKPRLVAKSGGGNVPRSLGKLNGAGSGPDASKVWNKNQPVPPPPPKQFTDEELKQQYGIHLATRLQADEAGKEAKWADIDDDEDDWAPETVQWMDGTKSTVAAVENEPPPPEEPEPVPQKDTPIILAKPASTPPTSTQKSSLTGGTKTILKPGAHAQATTSKSKGQTDKPTLVAKPSPAAPVKSPWAQLPPVDKVSPIQINPPAQQPPTSRFSRDVHNYDSMPPPLAKEIAPDDFNRSWREDRGNRELFNSHSGRYEPVSEMRRGSMRDSSYRQQPAVLQRPPHDGPAEPSAAFQTSRTSADAPAWGRRRNSSNVSGGSGRRMSFDRRVPDLPPLPANVERRESQSINGIDAGTPGISHSASPPKPPSTDQTTASLPPKPSPSLNAQPSSPFGSVGSQDVVSPGGPPQIQNLVEVQQRLLHDNLDTVKQRKQKEKEQEAKEEAERKERLRRKMEALGFTEDAKLKAKEEVPSQISQKSPQKEKAVPVTVQPPPKPPVPTSEGEVAQYGMMKVHQPQPVRKSFATESSAPKPSPSPGKAQTEAQPTSTPSITQAPPSSSTRDTDNSKPQVQQPQTEAQQSQAQGSKPNQPPQGPWSTSLGPQPRGWTSNVWGPPQTKERALGNGTFTQQVASQTKPGPAPIGSNPSLKPSPSQPQVAPSQPFTQQTTYSQAGTAPPQASTTTNPGPIAPPADKGWSNFHTQIRRDDRDQAAKSQREFDRMGGESFRPEIRETYTDQQGKSQTTLHSRVGGIEAKAPQPSTTSEAKPKEEAIKTTHDSPSVPHTTNQGSHIQPATQGARSSRFFPRPSESTQQPSSTSSKHDSPPPPETESHPAFSGDSTHPVVKMPKPSPRVRLPPTAVEPPVQPEAPVSMPSRVRFGYGARPLALTQEWQARFNSLLDKPSAPATTPAPITRPHSSTQAPSQAKPGSLAIAASSKAPLDVRSNLGSATVSLPATAGRKIFLDDDSSDVTSCVGAEFLLEDREFGSLPTVKLSKVRHLAANEPPVGFPPTPRQHSRYSQRHPSEYTSKPTYNGEMDKLDSLTIRIGNMQDAITKPIQRKYKGSKGTGHPKPKRNITNGTNDSALSSQSQRSRKPSNYQGQGSNPSSSPRASGGSGWSNSRSTPPNSRSTPPHNTNPNPWARRAAPSAPVH